MATLNGIVRFSGQVGDLIFYRRGKKDVVRSKSGNHQLSENSKKSAKDFGEVSRNAAYIRKAFAPMVRDYGYGDLISRLTKKIAEIFKEIPSSHLGNKKLLEGNLKLIEGFEFNAGTRLNLLLLQLPKVTLPTGSFIELLLPKIDLKHFVKRVPRAHEFILQVMVFNFDLNSGEYEILKVNDLRVSLDLIEFPGAKLSVPIEQEGDRAVFVAFGISYFHDKYRKEDSRYFACQIVHCMHVKDGVEVEFMEPLKEKVTPLKEEEQPLSWMMGGASSA